MTTHEDITVHLFTADDSITELTELLHRAYRPLAERGMEYLATHQDESVTRERISVGECWVALDADARIIGTITFVPANAPAEPGYYSRPGVAWFQQFAVEPAVQRRGVGSLLMDLVERRASQTGAKEIALDTADTATDLMAFYRKRGYEVVGSVDWDCTNYASVIMSGPVSPP